MEEITTEQYQDAIKYLTKVQMNTLLILYNCPNSSATSNELAKLLRPGVPEPHQIIANSRIGKIGKKFSKYILHTPEDYYDGRKDTPAYFRVIGPYNNETGWKMNPNLKIVIQNYFQIHTR